MKKLLFVSIFLLLLSISPNKVQAYGECSEYGSMVMYDSYSNTCKCMSGYVMSPKYGTTQCVLASSVCSDKLGYNSSYNSLTNSCECSYGYVLGSDSIGRTQCVSPDSLCKDQLGYNARYNSIYDKCECRLGYVISNGRCVDGDTFCMSEHGLYSSYNSSDKTCECDSGYTMNEDGQCIKKQNNVYFYLKELNTDDREAIVRSDYDSRYYLISYASGCYASSFKHYLRDRIVINLGTDFDLDTWDKIVLQNDDEVCDITHRERADSATTLVVDDEELQNNISQPVSVITSPVIKTPSIPKQTQPIKNTSPTKSEISKPDNKIISKKIKPTEVNSVKKNKTDVVTTSPTTTTKDMLDQPKNKKPGMFGRLGGFFKNLFSKVKL